MTGKHGNFESPRFSMTMQNPYHDQQEKQYVRHLSCSFVAASGDDEEDAENVPL